MPPSRTDVGAEQEAFRKAERELFPEEEKKPEIETRLEEEAPADGRKAFFVRTIGIRGNTAISEMELHQLVAPYENRTLTLAQVKEAAQEITRHYRARGFVTSRAYVPPQEIREGRVELRVLEGKLGKVEIKGNRFFRRRSLVKELSTGRGEILNYERLERDLLRINSNPDREVKAVLLPGEIPETTDVVLQIKDRLPLHAGYHFDNLGSRLTGRMRQGASFTDSNLLGFDDILFAKFQTTERNAFVGAAVDYVLPLRGSQTELELAFTHVNTKLGKDFEDLKVRGRANQYGVSLVERILETRHWEGSWVTGFDFKEVETSIGGRDHTRDNLRILRAGPQLIERDPWGRVFLTGEFDLGFPSFLGASDKADTNASTPGAGGQFFASRLGFARLQKLWLSSFLIFRGGAQFTPDKLVGVERYRLGGAETVRGYPEGDFLGDYGFTSNLEMRFPFYFIPASWKVPRTNGRLRDAFQFGGFFDLGRATVKGRDAGEEKTKTLMGIGGGLRINLARKIVSRIDWAYPIGSDPTEKKETRVHFSLTVEL